VEVRPARDSEEVGQALALREQVFCVEQGVELAADRDGLDDQAIQIVAIDAGRVIGTCRVLVDDGGIGRLGRMAVEGPSRGRGLGAAILAAAERSARDAGASLMRLHAQRYVEDLYRAAGYTTFGEPFVEEGIPHVSMEKRLA
jgi:predicted GNAT family N-acyltransferase